MFNMESIGRRIAELRKKANKTQMELADNMGITFQSISNWERGNTMPDISKLPELAELFDVTIDELLGKESKLIKNIIEDKEDGHAADEEISVSELVEAAPILKPETLDEIIEKNNLIEKAMDTDKKEDSMEYDVTAIRELLPFLSSDMIHICPFVIFSVGGVIQVFRRCAYPSEFPKPYLGVSQLVFRSFLEYFSHLLISVALCNFRIVCVLASSLCFSRKSRFKILFGLCSGIFCV